MPYIQFEDLEMYYGKLGIGEPIIFLHSHYSRGILAFSSQLLDFQQKYTCYFPDHRGHGRTKCDSLEWSTPQLAEDVIDFLEKLHIPKAHLIGYSCGGNVALYCAAKHPQKFATLTTIGCSGWACPEGANEFEPEWLIENGRYEMIHQMMERHEEAHRGNWQEFMRQSAKDWRLYPQLTREQLSSITCPAFFIAGEHDEFVTEEQLKDLCSLVKDSRYLIAPYCSHRPHMLREKPEFINDSILRFLNKYAIL
ncbi:alpha/beta hydrolase [Paenibacillus sp. FSL R10-2782]|uniref:alpha/beta fold hydrolase n=1 Tax=Paenibacillus sp. FSL R10-2782 TaxID=2954661 RepID=UPI0031598E1B